MACAFLLEIRRGTQSASLVIREASLRNLPADISVAPGRLEVRSGSACGAAALPPGVSLAPSSCRGLRRLHGDGLHLRLRLRDVPRAPELVYNLRESLKPQKNYIFYCQSCGGVIVKERKFLRVLPLPSENWSALVEEWCCHPNPFARSTLHPQHDDCFLGETFLLLNSRNESCVPESPKCSSETEHHTSQNDSTLKSKENTRVICERCKTTLGETVSSDTVKYYVTEVIIWPAEECFSTIPRSQFIQSMVAQCLVELSSAKSTFRFTIKGDNGRIYILIWLLNSDTLLVESSGSSSSHSVFTLFGDNFMPSCGPSGMWNAVKVLYQPCIKNRNKDLADAWENDFGVHPLKFPSETCLELLLILSLSTASLPPSLQRMNSFQAWTPHHLEQIAEIFGESRCHCLEIWEGCLSETVKNSDTYVGKLFSNSLPSDIYRNLPMVRHLKENLLAIQSRISYGMHYSFYLEEIQSQRQSYLLHPVHSSVVIRVTAHIKLD